MSTIYEDREHSTISEDRENDWVEPFWAEGYGAAEWDVEQGPTLDEIYMNEKAKKAHAKKRNCIIIALFCVALVCIIGLVVYLVLRHSNNVMKLLQPSELDKYAEQNTPLDPAEKKAMGDYFRENGKTNVVAEESMVMDVYNGEKKKAMATGQTPPSLSQELMDPKFEAKVGLTKPPQDPKAITALQKIENTREDREQKLDAIVAKVDAKTGQHHLPAGGALVPSTGLPAGGAGGLPAGGAGAGGLPAITDGSAGAGAATGLAGAPGGGALVPYTGAPLV